MKSEDLYIQSNGVTLTDDIKKNIINRINTDFYLDNYPIYKIKLTLYSDKPTHDSDSYPGFIEIFIKDKPKITSPVKSKDILTSIFLAIEHAYLRLSHNLSDDRSNQKRITVNKKSILYGSHRPYS